MAASTSTPPPPSLPRRVQSLAAAGARGLLLWLSQQQRLQRLSTEFGPARSMARRFVAGETRADAVAVVRALAGDGLRATVAFLGEHVAEAEAARTAAVEIEQVLRDLAAQRLEPNCSLKLTQLGLLFDAALAEDCLRRVLAVAGESAGFVRIDMEDSAVLPATLGMFERVRGEPGDRQRVGVAIQSYLRRSEADVRALIATGTAIRLVKGAYAEPPDVAYTRKADVDAAYVRLASLLLSTEAQTTGVYPAFATHDAAMIDAVRRMARERGIAADRYEFQMLLGVRRDLQIRLAGQGHRVRVYVPYGGQWYPYFMRRLAERPANLFFLMRNLLRR